MEGEGKAEVSLGGDGSAVPERKWQPCGIAEERAAAGLGGHGHAGQGHPWPQVWWPHLPAEHGLGEQEAGAPCAGKGERDGVGSACRQTTRVAGGPKGVLQAACCLLQSRVTCNSLSSATAVSAVGWLPYGEESRTSPCRQTRMPRPCESDSAGFALVPTPCDHMVSAVV